MHFSPERGRVTEDRDRDSPEWSVASDAEGGMRRAVRAVTNQEQRAHLKPSDRDRKCVQQTESVVTVAEQFFQSTIYIA
jgi:hypothetical protein